MNGMSVVKTVNGIKIHYSPFFEQFIVFFPKGDGNSHMERFPSMEEAEHTIQQDKDTEKYWWMQENL